MKRVLDACCGSRMFYFDKRDPDVIFADVRELETTLCDGRTLLVKPDGLLVFKWSEDQIKFSEVIKTFGKKPLLGDQRGKTRWVVFIK